MAQLVFNKSVFKISVRNDTFNFANAHHKEIMAQMLNVQEIRRELENELDQLLSKQPGLGSTNQRRAINPDRSYLAQQYTRQERQLALRDIEAERLTQIQEALQQIENGSYGICINCHEIIEPERLKIIPYTTMCVRCRRQQDQQIG